ncbi:MAG: peptide chain release factor N(5)-glutamine methyltransferase [Bacteroidota bacterium]
MLTVLSALKLASEYFEKKGISSSRANAEILLANTLNCKRLDLYLKFDQPLKEIEVEIFRQYIARRGKYEPVQYIVGNTEFYGLILEVNPSVLIPRPETEILVETILNEVNAADAPMILDIGCGSGNISIALAKNIPNAEIFSVDISEAAIEVAQNNARKNNAQNINFIIGNIVSNDLLNEYFFDVIVSNPPYVGIDDYNSLHTEITSYEPVFAVTDNEDGLKFYRKISEIAAERLKKCGKLFFEIGFGQSSNVHKIMFDQGFEEIKIVKDYQRINRVIYGIKK